MYRHLYDQACATNICKCTCTLNNIGESSERYNRKQNKDDENIS